MSLLIILLIIYLTVSAIVLAFNLIKKYQCKYFIKHLLKNQRQNKHNKNYDYQESIINLLTSAQVPQNNVFISSNTIVNAFGIDRVCKSLLIAKGKFHNRAIRCYQWVYKILKHTLRYSPSKRAEVNYVVRFILFLLETLFVYLLCLWLDTTDIGGKILTAITDAVNK